MGVRHHMAGAPVDPLFGAAHRPRSVDPAVPRRPDGPGQRPRTAVRHNQGASVMGPGMQGTLVLILTLMMLLSGAPVAFGLGTIAIIFIDRKSTRLNSSH